MCNPGLAPGIICQLENVKTLIWDSPKGNCASREGWVFVNLKTSKNNDFGFPEGRLHQSGRVGICQLKQVRDIRQNLYSRDCLGNMDIVFVPPNHSTVAMQ